MKSLALLTVSILVLASSTLGSAAAIQHHRSAPARAHSTGALFHMLSSSRLALMGGGLASRPHVSPAQANPTATPTPTATGTSNSYPDPEVILRNSIIVLEQVTNVHFQNIIDAQQVKTATLHIDIPGDATCKGPAMKGSVTGKQTLEGTSQSSSYKASFIWIKNTAWIKSKSTHQRWQKSKKTQISPLGFAIRFKEDLFPLICTTGAAQVAAHLSPPAQNVQLKDLVNLGPDTFQGIPVWHIHGVFVQTDSSGQTVEIPFDFYISQDHYLPYVTIQTVNDTASGITLTNKTVMTKFGVKVVVKKPKAGTS